MKKKMLKRTFVLGALMAFVITGSALAATSDTIHAKGQTNTESIDIINHGRGVKTGIRATNFDTTTNLIGENLSIDLSSSSSEVSGIYAKGNNTFLNLGGENTKNINIKVLSTAEKGTVGIARALKIVGGDSVNGPQVILTSDNLSIEAESAYAYAEGINVSNMTTDTQNGKAKVVINSKNTTINVIGNDKYKGVGIVTYSEGQLEINNNLTVNADIALSTRGDAQTIINKDGAGTVKLTGDIEFDYDAPTSGTKIEADTQINLTDAESFLTGRIYKDSEAPEGKNEVNSMQLNISNDAAWNVTGDSFVNTIALANAGKVNMLADTEKLDVGVMKLDNGAVNLLGDGQQVNVMNAEGVGTVNTSSLANNMSIASLADGTAVTVNGSAAIADAIGAGDADLQALADVVTTGEGENEKSAAVAVTTAEGTIVGAYSAQVDADGNVVAGSVREAVNSTNKTIAESGSALRLHWRAHMNDMNKRMGELRDSKGEHGIWARMTRGENEYRGVTTQYNLYQLGYDEKLGSDPTWTVGAALTHSEGSSSFAKGSTDDKSTGLAIYGSKLNEDGSFIDLIAKYARMDSDMTLGASKGDYGVNGFSVSAEYGKRFTNGSGLWLEPQAELTYGYVSGAEYSIAGRDVTLDGMKSLVGRLGFALGKNISKGNVYARASYLYDFDGEAEGRFTDGIVTRSVEEDLGGGWWEVGVGTNINLSKATHLYFDLEKTYGGNVDTRWQWNAGVRYSF